MFTTENGTKSSPVFRNVTRNEKDGMTCKAELEGKEIVWSFTRWCHDHFASGPGSAKIRLSLQFTITYLGQVMKLGGSVYFPSHPCKWLDRTMKKAM
jgi:hypothetical protein